MTYTVVELTRDGSFFNTAYRHMSKEDADAMAEKLNATEIKGSEYFSEKDNENA